MVPFQQRCKQDSTSRMPPRSSNNLRRRAPRREPRRRFILVCEGKNTEPAYFDAVRQLFKDALIEVQIEGAMGVPLTIARKAAQQAEGLRRQARDSYEENDEIWAVFDRDAHPDFDRAIAVCNAAGVNIARSNPCFEIWLILHYCDYNAPLGRHKAQKHFQTLCPMYKARGGKNVDTKPLMNNIEQAEKRAERQLKERSKERAEFGEPSTTVGQLTKSIRTAARRFSR